MYMEYLVFRSTETRPLPRFALDQTLENAFEPCFSLVFCLRSAAFSNASSASNTTLAQAPSSRSPHEFFTTPTFAALSTLPFRLNPFCVV